MSRSNSARTHNTNPTADVIADIHGELLYRPYASLCRLRDAYRDNPLIHAQLTRIMDEMKTQLDALVGLQANLCDA